ncbi:MAG: site-2 protease family protein [SAR202 cluster bacterium]|nr:site-2 protease family protein [SAR202 cluster bacterium]
MITVLIFLAMLVALVLVHEFGHFLTARAFGVKVLEFGIGYPPRLFGFTRGETTYSVNLLPLGGFVKLLGEEDPTDARSLAAQALWKRFVVIFAGAFMNFILPVGVFFAIAMVPQNVPVGRVQLQGVAPDSPAARAGLKPGDMVLRIDGHDVRNTQELAYRIRLRLGAETEWEVLRQKQALTAPIGGGREPGFTPSLNPVSSETFVTRLTPRWRPPEGQGASGVSISTVNARFVKESSGPWSAFTGSFVQMGETLILFRNEITGWIIRATTPQFAGPVGIAQVTGEVARTGGFVALLGLAALLSLNLAILNVLPIPMLDGGRLLFLGIEFVRRGKRVSPKREALVHMIGFVLLISLVVVISFFDISRIVRGDSLLR